jgi:hypothetical protein
MANLYRLRSIKSPDQTAPRQVDYRKMFGPGVGLAKWAAQVDTVDRIPVRAGPGQISALSILHSKSSCVWCFCMGARAA